MTSSGAQFSKLVINEEEDDDRQQRRAGRGSVELLEQGSRSSSATISLDRLETRPRQYRFLDGMAAIVLSGPLNLLLLATPFALASKSLGLHESLSFLLALLSIAPFAERLGFVTEQISIHTSDVIGGLLNATFGNATELILSISALRRGYFRIIQLSLLGSILSNTLLVLGSALCYGGTKFKLQKFDKITVQINCTLLLLGAAMTGIPTVMLRFDQTDEKGILNISRFASVIMLVMYVLYLYFQVRKFLHFID